MDRAAVALRGVVGPGAKVAVGKVEVPESPARHRDIHRCHRPHCPPPTIKAWLHYFYAGLWKWLSSW